MANHQLLFGRPLVADETLPPLSVTGALEGYTSGEAYDSELDINNSVGRCTLTVIESTLPPGARVFIDQLRKKVVVRWDAYTPPVETVQLVPNGDFEAGDDGRWGLGPGWTIGSGADYPVQDGTHSARFKDYKGTSDMVLASVPAKTNDYIKIDAMIQHGASSEGNVGARVSLVWRAEDGRELDRNLGNYISSGSKGAWKTSTAKGYGPGDARYVSVVLSAKRSRQNHGLFVDKIVWNHKYTLGTNTDTAYYVRLRVTDSINRQAEWAGAIPVSQIMLFSQLYGYYVAEGIDSNSGFVLGDLKEQPFVAEGVDSAMSVEGAWALTMAVRPYSSRPEGINSTLRANTGWALVTSVKAANVHPEGVDSALTVPSTWVQLNAQIIAAYPPEGITTGMTVRPWSKS